MPDDLPDLNTILHSGALAYGKHGLEFEQKLKAYVGVEQLVTVSSFNSAVLVALISLGIKPGDEIISSPMACLASNQPIVTLGAKVAWADVDPMTGTIDPESVRKKISSETKAIFHNHFCGYPGYIDEINAIGEKYGVIVVDDAIEAFGSEYKGNKIGNNGTDITIYSFQAVRLPTTIDGGAIVFKDKSFYEKSLLVRDSGISRSYFRDNLGEINPNYDISVPGFGATMSEVNSYIGVQQMNDLQTLVDIQRDNAQKWNEWFSENMSECYLLNQRENIVPNFWVYGILIDNKKDILRKFREMGYHSSVVHLPNNYYSIFGKNEFLPGVDEFYSKFLAVPCGWWFHLNKSLHV